MPAQQFTGPQLKVLFNYDSFGRTLLQTEVETNDLTGAQGTSAQAVGTARTTTWTYNSQGSVLTVKEPRTDVNATTTFAYDGNQTQVLRRHRVPFLFMNTPLCALPPGLWDDAHKSISDWKNVYANECSQCAVRNRCAGLFAWHERGWKPTTVRAVLEVPA